MIRKPTLYSLPPIDWKPLHESEPEGTLVADLLPGKVYLDRDGSSWVVKLRRTAQDMEERMSGRTTLNSAKIIARNLHIAELKRRGWISKETR